jgi:hypothetical protein
MSDFYVRLRTIRRGPVTYSVHGISFVAGQWAVVPEQVKLPSGDVFDLAQYLEGLRHTDGVQDLFDVTDQEGANKIEQREIEKEERARAAAKLSLATNTPVSRAIKLGDGMAVPESELLSKAPVRADGEERVSAGQLEEAQAETEGEEQAGPHSSDDGADKSARRSARAARMAAKAGANPATAKPTT